MTRPPYPTALYGAWLVLLGAVGAAVFGWVDPAPPALFFAGGGIMLLLAAWFLLSPFGDSERARIRALPDLSPSIPWIAVSIALLAISAEVGFWLALIAAGMIAVGLFGLARELQAQRAAYRRAIEEHALVAPGGRVPSPEPLPGREPPGGQIE